ncbi:uncharacterized protein MAM_02566 [Metarhizium album ARSEF 1941]|uniref:Uncharacterized protein n=1 Tax=Metarhizium album (strain ARSEF 1941) TaxID=1081103 RepID=A0A0B2X093_METAS|nr:uncharacterized protein MAM_02566 [Metarhizium album ARSEF 1941]KHN99713.1 hypothetical protein MAM_02566 [Metarhizium album ARSEF 1941]
MFKLGSRRQSSGSGDSSYSDDSQLQRGLLTDSASSSTSKPGLGDYEPRASGALRPASPIFPHRFTHPKPRSNVYDADVPPHQLLKSEHAKRRRAVAYRSSGQSVLRQRTRLASIDEDGDGDGEGVSCAVSSAVSDEMFPHGYKMFSRDKIQTSAHGGRPRLVCKLCGDASFSRPVDLDCHMEMSHPKHVAVRVLPESFDKMDQEFCRLGVSAKEVLDSLTPTESVTSDWRS